MRIDVDKIINNVITTLVTAIVIGACVIVWNGATSVDKKVTAATTTINQTVEYTKKAVETVESELLLIKAQNSNLVESVNRLQAGLANQIVQQGLPQIYGQHTNRVHSNLPIFEPPHETVNVSQLPVVEKGFILNRLPQAPMSVKE